MHNSKEAAPAGRRRGRLLATAGIGVAAVLGSLVAAAPASAATTTDPSVILDMPNNIANDNEAANVDITIDNTQAGSGDLSNLRFQASLTTPSGLTCTAANPMITPGSGTVTIDGQSHQQSSPPLTYDSANSTAQKCVYYVAAPASNGLKQNEKDQFTYSLSVDGRHPTQPPTTGTLNGTFKVIQQDSSGTFEGVLASDSDTSKLSNPSAPSFNAAPTNGAVLYHSYSYQLVNSKGFPETPEQPQAEGSDTPNEGYYAYGSHDNGDGTYTTTGPTGTTCDSSGTPQQNCYIVLESGGHGGQFEFNATTGEIESITAPGTPGATNSINPAPYWTWTIIANNGHDGSSTAKPASDGNPPVNPGDVDSAPFTLPVLFGDVPTSNQFASEIYSLALQDVILGYGDGNFKSTTAIHRQEFATFEMRVLNDLLKSGDFPNVHNGEPFTNGTNGNGTGACDAKGGETSGFSDVSANNQFCEQIRDLSRAGIINGFTDGTFRPRTIVRRQEIAGLLFRADSYLKGAQVGDASCQTPVPFNDVSADNVFCGDIEWLTNHDITKGFNDGGFHPKAATLRQEGSAFFYRFGNFEAAGTFTDPFAS
jgi:hypothetical protein